jgi:hypothetical protein
MLKFYLFMGRVIRFLFGPFLTSFSAPLSQKHAMPPLGKNTGYAPLTQRRVPTRYVLYSTNKWNHYHHDHGAWRCITITSHVAQRSSIQHVRLRDVEPHVHGRQPGPEGARIRLSGALELQKNTFDSRRVCGCAQDVLHRNDPGVVNNPLQPVVISC